VIVDSDDLTLAQASRLAGLQTSGTLYRAAQTGRLTTVTTMVGPRIVRLTTQASGCMSTWTASAARHRGGTRHEVRPSY